MKTFIFASILCLFSLNLSGQCPVLWADQEGVLTDSEAIWWTSEEEKCDGKKPLSVFPNPTSDYFEVRNYGTTEWYLFDLQGRIIRKIDVSTTVNISDLPSAMYILKTNNSILKIIKQ